MPLGIVEVLPLNGEGSYISHQTSSLSRQTSSLSRQTSSLSRQTYFPYHPIPVGLGVLSISMTAAIHLFGHSTGIVYQQTDGVTARLQFGQQKAVGCRNVIARIHELPVHIQPCWFGTLQKEL